MAKRDPLWIASAGGQQFDQTELRQMFSLFQAGVVGAGDFLVTPGSGLALSSAAGQAIIMPSGGADTQPGRYLVADSTAEGSASWEGGPIAANGSGNPRLDAVVLKVFDHDYVSSGGRREWVRQYVPGVASAGAALGGTLPALPNSSLLIAEVLIPAGATTDTSIPSANIRDRRPSAKGFSRPAAGSTSDPTKSDTVPGVMPEMSITGEFAGGQVAVIFDAAANATAGQEWEYEVRVDGVAPSGNGHRRRYSGTGSQLPLMLSDEFNVTAGRHTIAVYWWRATSSGGMVLTSTYRTLRVFETARPVSAAT